MLVMLNNVERLLLRQFCNVTELVTSKKLTGSAERIALGPLILV